MLRRIFAVAALSLLLAGSSCEDIASVQLPASVAVEVASGDGQAAALGEPLPAPVVVALVDSAGFAYPGVPVTWSVLSGGGAAFDREATTDSAGRARASWRLGTRFDEPQVLEARFDDSHAAVFTAEGYLPDELDVRVVTGDSQSVSIGNATEEPLAVSVSLLGGRPVIGVPVAWEASAGATVDSVSTTDTAGIARTTWQSTAPHRDTVSVQARVDSANVAHFTLIERLDSVTLALIDGDAQVGSVEETLPQPIRVLVSRNGAPLVGVHLNAVADEANGAAVGSIVSDGEGIAEVEWRLGPALGQQGLTLRAGASELGLSATGTASFVDVEIGSLEACALSDTGRVYCWGAARRDNGFHTADARPTPFLVLDVERRYAGLAKGDDHVCALTDAGQVECIGDNEYGQLGNATALAALRFSDVQAGEAHTCGLTADSQVLCWGRWIAIGTRDLEEGQEAVPIPTPPALLPPLDRLGSVGGGNATCGIRHAEPEEVWCWGMDWGGGTGALWGMPSYEAGRIELWGAGILDVAVGARSACRIENSDAGDVVNCVGSYDDGQAAEPEMNFVSIAPGAYFTCGLTATAEAWCWGRNDQGELGDGTMTSSTSPVRVAIEEPIRAITTGQIGNLPSGRFACAVTVAGSLYCWGSNAFGELGRGEAGASSAMPQKIVGSN